MDTGDAKCGKPPVPALATAIDRIKRLRAKRYLDAVDEKRAWLHAAQPLSQTQLAAAMGVSQPYVSNMLRKARSEVGEQPRDGFHGSSAYEIAARYRVGEIDRPTMLDELTRWTYATQSADPAEQTVIKILGEILEIDPSSIAPTDTFAALHIDLDATVLTINRAFEAFGRDVTAVDFWNAASDRGLLGLQAATALDLIDHLRRTPPTPDARQNALLDADLWRVDGQVRVAGSFADEIGRAFDEGLLTDDDYDELVDRWAQLLSTTADGQRRRATQCPVVTERQKVCDFSRHPAW